MVTGKHNYLALSVLWSHRHWCVHTSSRKICLALSAYPLLLMFWPQDQTITAGEHCLTSRGNHFCTIVDHFPITRIKCPSSLKVDVLFGFFTQHADSVTVNTDVNKTWELKREEFFMIARADSVLLPCQQPQAEWSKSGLCTTELPATSAIFPKVGKIRMLFLEV